MALASTDQILQSTHQWLKPLIHVLLNCGITWREFAQLAHTTYVEVASEDFGKRGRPTNVSRTIGRCGGADVRPSTLLKELIAAGAVRARPDGRLEAIKRDYIPHTMDAQLVRLWGTVIADVAATYVHNLTRAGKTTKRFERSAVNDRMPMTALPGFARLLEQEGQAFLERVDKWLAAQQRKLAGRRGTGQKVRLGVGLYQIQD
jgi:hypothetical protein